METTIVRLDNEDFEKVVEHVNKNRCCDSDAEFEVHRHLLVDEFLHADHEETRAFMISAMVVCKESFKVTRYQANGIGIDISKYL